MTSTQRILGENANRKPRKKKWTPETALKFAQQTGKRQPDLEPIIATRAMASYYYAVRCLKGRFPAGEPTIAMTPWAYNYARQVIGGRWPAGEPYLAARAHLAVDYARDVINGRWPEAEPTIAADKGSSVRYLRLFPQARQEWVALGYMDVL